MKSRRRREWFRRSSAMFMALALIISGLSLPEGLFSITAKAAEKASAEWTVSSTMYADGDNDNSVTELNGKSGKLVNSNNDELLINANSGKITKRSSDYLVNPNTELTFPIVNNAKTCTITLRAYVAVTADNMAFTGMSNIKITEQSGNGWAYYIIEGTVDKGASSVTLTTNVQNYFQSIKVDSSTSYATTSASFADGGDTKAEWGYSETVLSSKGSTSSIQSDTGTYTNGDKDVLYVDATSGKFQPKTDGTNRIQVNTGTKIVIPAAGDKAVIKLTVNKNVGTDKDSILGNTLNITGSDKVLRKMECISCVANSDSGYVDVEFECYLTGDEGELTLDVKTNTYIRNLSIECIELNKKVINGTITSKSDIPSDMQVVATNNTTGLTYTSDITVAENGKSGTYSIEVPAEDEVMEYEISLSNPAYQIKSGIYKHSVSTETAAKITADLTIISLDTCTVTGKINGITDGYFTEDFELVFTTTEETDYVPEVTIDTDTWKYTAKFEKGVSYSVAVKGANDYEVTSVSDGIKYSEDAELDITVGLKPTYAVTVSLPEEPDLTGKNVKYIYMNNDDGYDYVFTDKDAIKLREGSYTLTLGGDFLALPYKVKSGNTVTVKGAEASHKLTFEQVTSWSFVKSDDGDYYDDNIMGTTGYYNGLAIDATKGKLVPNGASPNSAQFTTGAKITIPVSGKCTISVESYKPASTYALYTIAGEPASKDDVTTVYNYEDESEGTVEIVSTGSAYIVSISVVYAAKDVEYNEQLAMPKTYDYGTASNLVVQPTGQKLVLTQTGGTLNTTTNTDKSTNINNTVSFFGFDETTDANKLTADITITECGSSNTNGIFFGAFNKNYIDTVGIRNSNALKMVYSKKPSDLAGASSKVDTTIPAGTVVTFTVEKTDDALVITATPKGGETKTATYSYSASDNLLFNADKKNTAVSYGFVLAGVKATIQNMKYIAQDGTVLYDQNKCYNAVGTAPVVKEVTAKAAYTRDYITVSWTDEVPAEGDGLYVLEVSRDNGKSWEKVASDITEPTYKYSIKDAGDYKFRVAGKLGINGEINDYVESDAITVIAALDSPKASIASSADTVDLVWDAVDKADQYEVYRYSYDETAENASKIATVTECAYKDKDVTAEMPYYYYIIAYSHVNGKVDNYSNPSDTLWTVPTAGHTGKYVYEDDAVKYTITKKSYDTVYNGKITIEGVVEENVTAALYVNGSEAAKTDVKEKESFAFKDIAIEEGRNDVELIFTDKKGNKTRETFNYVYLTNYNKVVDSAYTGTDGEEVNGIPTYKTVQAAVDSVASDNTRRVIILVKEGDYEEHLVVKSPYITLIGEDSEKTRIYYDVKELAGGDMSLRCAVRIDKTATGFSAENLTIENTYNYLGDGTKSNESADALRNDANETSYINLRILGYQDTLCANGGTQYYYKCYIAGNVDFIYGNEPRALFNDCKLVFRYNANKNSGYVSAPKASASATYGLTFFNCQVLSEEGCSGSKYYLARPWGADAYITWINCYMGKILKPNASNPYTDMSGNLAANARFFEYGSYGPAFAINSNRRQISATKANEMTSTSYLGWDPYTIVGTIRYTGTVKTDSIDRYVEKEYVSDTYSKTEGDDTGLAQYAQEGYAQSANVTGGGLLKETSDNYYTAGTAEEFLNAIQSVKKSGKASVIELTADIALGDKEVNNFDSYSTFITAHKLEPLTHPALLKTGVSMLKLADMSNLTIYSKNGAKITHTCIDITGSNNIIIRNIEFDEIWEWDDYTEGAYDRNDWDYMTIEKGSSDIWVDHCTFYKSYDGVIDVKTPVNDSNITISWCEFLPASEDNVFFDEMMNAMKANPDNYPYYKHLLEEGMTDQQIYNYAYGQKKTHLLGQSDDDSSAKNIKLTLANNYYKNSMDRMPRLRYGTAHVYNCIMDAQDLREMRLDIEKTNPELAKKIVSNGASSNCGAHMLLENCYMSGITNALISGNGSSPAGYINAFNTIYMMDGAKQELKVALNTDKEGEVALVQDKDEFKKDLPYTGYTLYAASELDTKVKPYTGAGKLTLTTLQWEKTSYNEAKQEHTEHVWNDGEVQKEATCTEEGSKLYTCIVCGDTKTEVIPAAGHNYSTEWTIDKEATTTEEGSKSHHCTVCGDKADITVIPKLENTQPGDNDNKPGDNDNKPGDNDNKPGDNDNKPGDNNKPGSDNSDVKTDIKVSVLVDERVPETGLVDSTEDIIKAILTEDEAKQAENGVKVDIALTVKDKSSNLTEDEKKLINSNIKANQAAGCILDIQLQKIIGSQKSDVYELNSAINIKVKLNSDLINKDSSKTRKYSVIRIHNGISDILSAAFDEATGELTFATDRFSTYIVVYEDVANSNTEDKSNVSGNGSAADNNDVAGDSAATADDSAATADTLSVTRTIILLAVLMISAGVICLTLYRRKENA
jgi:pectin methylesterase-like acyl-CoA thioesterase/pectate lyase